MGELVNILSRVQHPVVKQGAWDAPVVFKLMPVSSTHIFLLVYLLLAVVYLVVYVL